MVNKSEVHHLVKSSAELQANFPGYFSLDLLILTNQSESGFHNTGNKNLPTCVDMDVVS